MLEYKRALIVEDIIQIDFELEPCETSKSFFDTVRN